jgi:hypothetical protein
LRPLLREISRYSKKDSPRRSREHASKWGVACSLFARRARNLGKWALEKAQFFPPQNRAHPPSQSAVACPQAHPSARRDGAPTQGTHEACRNRGGTTLRGTSCLRTMALKLVDFLFFAERPLSLPLPVEKVREFRPPAIFKPRCPWGCPRGEPRHKQLRRR